MEHGVKPRLAWSMAHGAWGQPSFGLEQGAKSYNDL